MTEKRLRAIDLYSGVGGWSLGLQMAGIEVVRSYEIWSPANETNLKNNHHRASAIDIRSLRLKDLPKRIDIVVGSPPCTQFSFSNRGGTGDIADGLEDVTKFLQIVNYLRPKFWAMENVPRVAKIIENELKEGGKLQRFQKLGMKIEVLDMEALGLPQRRKRCIAGNFDFQLLKTYFAKSKPHSLGEVVTALSENPARDPLYGITVPVSDLHDHEAEDFLDKEETRINRASKKNHPVYNKMSFPDRLNRSVRTITATCTRVSRESIVIRDANDPKRLRRLTLRERASLQGFPITFQFYGANYGEKMRMVGNAVPPAFSFFVGQAFLGVHADRLLSLHEGIKRFAAPATPPPSTPPGRAGKRFSKSRTFRFAIPNLRLASGVRFELANAITVKAVQWRVTLVFGNSKSIHRLRLDQDVYESLVVGLRRALPAKRYEKVEKVLRAVKGYSSGVNQQDLQKAWSRSGKVKYHPFALLDSVDTSAKSLRSLFEGQDEALIPFIERALDAQFGLRVAKLAGRQKLARNAPLIAAGLLVGSTVNMELARSGLEE